MTASTTHEDFEYARWLDSNVSTLVKADKKNAFEVFSFASENAKDAKISYAHMGTMCETKRGLFCAAFQCSTSGCEGKPGQHVRFCTSEDKCETWTETKVPMFGLNALWSPVLHYLEQTDEILLFYSESRKQLSPGGDVKLIRTRDEGMSWSEPETILTHEALGGVPKVIANRVCRGLREECLRLPFWTEPTDSWLRYRQYHPMEENASLKKKVYHSPPGSRDDDSESVYSGTIDSHDGGKTWEAPRIKQLVKFPEHTWLIENSVLRSALQNDYSMYMRSATGEVWYSSGDDAQQYWSTPEPIPNLPNPNSKVSANVDSFVYTTANGEVKERVVLALNPSKTKRAPLGLYICRAHNREESGNQKYPFIEVEGDPNGNFAYPTTFISSDGSVFVIYTAWDVGIRVYRVPSLDLETALVS